VVKRRRGVAPSAPSNDHTNNDRFPLAVERLSPVPHQDPERAKQPGAGCEKRADDPVPRPIARKCRQCKSEGGDAAGNEHPGRLRGRKKRY
jgi:hypothetical protein